MKVDIISIENYEKNANGLVKINLNHLPLPPDFLNLHQLMIYIPAMQLGGNHRHPRREIFLSLSDDVEFHWIDETGIKHINKMKEENQIFMFVAHPFVPHAIMNCSNKSAAVLFELADDCQHAIEPYEVISIY